MGPVRGIAGRSFRAAKEGSLVFGLPLIAFQASQAERGEMISTAVTETAALGLTSIIALAVGGVVAVAFPGVGTVVGVDLIIAALAGEAAEAPASWARKKIRQMTDAERNASRLNMGGNYRDTQYAAQQRMLAVQQMNAAMIPSRRYLGQEGLLFHR